MKIKQAIFGIIGITFTALGFIAKAYYRNYIYSNNINDYGLADALPSLLYVIGFSQLLLIKPPVRPGILITMVTLASILFEIRQIYSYGMTDFRDIGASVAGGIISYLIWFRVNSSYKSKN